MTDGIGQTRVTIGKGQGITQALKALVEKNKMKLSDGGISKAEWNATVKVLDDIQANRKANNQKSIFGNGYVVHSGDNIDFTEDEMTKIYKAMGVEISDEQAPVQQTSAEAVEQTAQNSRPPVATNTEQPEHAAQAPAADSQNEKLEAALQKNKFAESYPDAKLLRENGFGAKAFNTVQLDSGNTINIGLTKDENGLFYTLDKNAGRTYTNDKGDKIRISKFEAQNISKGGTAVQYSSADGKSSSETIYDKDGKPVQGELTQTQDDGTTVSYKYKYDANGNKVVQSSYLQPAPITQTIDGQTINIVSKPIINITEEEAQKIKDGMKAQLERYNQAMMADFDKNVKVEYDEETNDFKCKGFKHSDPDMAKYIARKEMQFLVDNREKYLEQVKNNQGSSNNDSLVFRIRYETDLKVMNMRLGETGLFEDIE